MKLLILGGTNYVGRAMAQDALDRGWEVTLLHRGNHKPPEGWNVKEILCDRQKDISAADGTWDAVLDVSAYLPSEAKRSAEFFKRKTGRYAFVSTVSVYDPSEDGWLGVKPFDFKSDEKVTAESYGPMKLTCERIIEENFGPKTTIIRPGFVVGPYDSTLRMPYWVDRFDRFDRVLVPKDISVKAQQIDARDLAVFTNDTIERSFSGVYTVVGEAYTFEEIFAKCPGFQKSKLARCPTDILEKAGVEIGRQLPLIPDGAFAAAMRNLDCSAALGLGLKRRPLEESLADVLSWLKTLPNRESLMNGEGERPVFSRQKEEEILAKL